jgi:hypothetical protein
VIGCLHAAIGENPPCVSVQAGELLDKVCTRQPAVIQEADLGVEEASGEIEGNTTGSQLPAGDGSWLNAHASYERAPGFTAGARYDSGVSAPRGARGAGSYRKDGQKR